jgi:signal transduction histidine kinase
MKTTPKTTAKITKQKRTILIADDQPAHLEAITATLQYAPEEYYVISVQNGREACEMAEREQPDLIIMDWMMPEMDGFEALQHLKKQPNTSEIPVIMLTSLDSSKRIEQAFTAGANDYIRSPIDKLELQARVRSTLALSESYKQIKEQAHRLELRNQEIAQQRELLEQQAVEIRVANAKLQQANKSLQLKNSQLTELNYEKNELLGIAAHDLKNPISNIRMLAQILLTEAETLSLDERREYSSDILTDAAKMYDLVMKLLDISAIESGVMKLNLTLFDLGVAAHSVTENYHGRAAKKSIVIHFQSWPNALPVYADQTATMQVLDNLISNAVKYSPFDTNVYVRASEVENSGGEKISRVEVQDEGPGLNEEDKKRLFGKFAKLSAQPTGGENSTGLGLSIAKKIIETMNGRIWCESEEGHGAMFVIELPQS